MTCLGSGPRSEACERNKGPILEVLRAAFADTRRVLEVGSGTGQHAAWFAAHLPHLAWQPSETEGELHGLGANLRGQLGSSGLPNLAAPIALDVRGSWPEGPYDAVFTANTLHIMNWDAVVAFFSRLPAVLARPCVLCAYGPFQYAGRHTSASNEDFDRMLQARGTGSGLRDVLELGQLAQRAGLVLVADHAMPANNRTLVFRGPP